MTTRAEGESAIAILTTNGYHGEAAVISDLLTRVDLLERQLRRVTAEPAPEAPEVTE